MGWGSTADTTPTVILLELQQKQPKLLVNLGGKNLGQLGKGIMTPPQGFLGGGLPKLYGESEGGHFPWPTVYIC